MLLRIRHVLLRGFNRPAASHGAQLGSLGPGAVRAACEGGVDGAVVGVVVSAFLLTPFFVCQEHRRDRYGQRQQLAQQASGSLLKPSPF